MVLLAWSLQLLHVVPISPLLGHGTRSGTPKLDGSQDDKVLWMPRKKWPRLRPFGEHHPFLYGEFLHSSSRLKTMFFFKISPILVGIHWNFHILSQDDHILLGPFYGQLLFSWVNFYQASTADGSQLPLWCSESGESSPGPTTDLFNGKPWSFSGNTAFLFPFQMGTCAVFYIALLVINIGDCRDCLWEMVM